MGVPLRSIPCNRLLHYRASPHLPRHQSNVYRLCSESLRGSSRCFPDSRGGNARWSQCYETMDGQENEHLQHLDSRD